MTRFILQKHPWDLATEREGSGRRQGVASGAPAVAGLGCKAPRPRPLLWLPGRGGGGGGAGRTAPAPPRISVCFHLSASWGAGGRCLNVPLAVPPARAAQERNDGV